MPLQKSALLLLHAETPLHPGTGSALGTVDLPVARERHTQWPFIPASSLKGVLRDRCRPDENENGARNEWLAVFGPETEKASDYAGALSFTDCRLLAYPVRSLRGLFAWVTCPGLLLRLQRDLRMTENAELAEAVKGAVEAASAVTQDRMARVASTELTTGARGANMVLEEFDYEAAVSEPVQALGASLDALLGLGTRLGSHLAVVSDNAFTHYARYATEVMARIGLDYKTKTVKDRALFYEEFLPAGSLFYSTLIASAAFSRETTALGEPDDVLSFVQRQIPKHDCILQIGGDATIGKGLCQAVLAREVANA